MSNIVNQIIIMPCGMQMTFTIAQMLVRITGVLALIIGLTFFGAGPPNGVLLDIHMLLGVVLVLSLWLLAALASQMSVPVGMYAAAAIIALLVLVLGLTQRGLLPGGIHWIVQVIHLLLGMAAVASGEMIGGTVRRQRLAATSG